MVLIKCLAHASIFYVLIHFGLTSIRSRYFLTQMRKLRHVASKSFSHRHTAEKGQSPANLFTELALLTIKLNYRLVFDSVSWGRSGGGWEADV